MAELKSRGIVRSNNNPTGDVGELQVAKHLGLELTANSVKGYDATDTHGIRYQIKTRRHVDGERKSRQLGGLRDLNDNLFDYLLGAIINENYEIIELWKIPYETVLKYIKSTTRGHMRLMLNGDLLLDSSVLRIL